MTVLPVTSTCPSPRPPATIRATVRVTLAAGPLFG